MFPLGNGGRSHLGNANVPTWERRSFPPRKRECSHRQPVQRLVVLQVRGLHAGARAIREERPASLLEDGLRRLPVRQVEHEGGANSAVLSTAQPARQQAAERTKKRTRSEDGTLSGRDCVASLAVFVT